MCVLRTEPLNSPVPHTFKKKISMCICWGTDMPHTHLVRVRNNFGGSHFSPFCGFWELGLELRLAACMLVLSTKMEGHIYILWAQHVCAHIDLGFYTFSLCGRAGAEEQGWISENPWGDGHGRVT